MNQIPTNNTREGDTKTDTAFCRYYQSSRGWFIGN